MKPKYIKYIISASIIALSTSGIDVYANENVSISPIFTQEQGLWYPGRVESKDFYITNNNENNISIDKLYIELKSSKDLSNNQILDIESKQFKELSQNSTVKISYKDNLLFQDKLDNLLSEKGIVLPQEIGINPNEEALLNMTIDMDEKMNNDAQALENIFSIGVAYKIDETNPSIEPPINPDTDVDSDLDKLPQTGGMINSMSLIAIGGIAVGTGVMLNKKSEKGEDCDE